MEETSATRTEEETLRWLLRRADALGVAYMAVELEEWGYPSFAAEPRPKTTRRRTWTRESLWRACSTSP
jgi:hypothetical protein